MVLVDLTREISEDTPVFPCYPRVKIIVWSKHDVHGFGSELLFAPTHVSTHMDAPLHFKAGGKSIDETPLELMIGYAVVIDARGHHVVPGSVVEKGLAQTGFRRGDAVFVYTGWEDRYGSPEYVIECPGLSEDAARKLVEAGASIVGIDSPSIDPGESTEFPAHHVLLGAGVPVIENLCNLGGLVGRRLRYYALPLKIKGATASPIRVLVEA